jgi:hypothetical protein
MLPLPTGAITVIAKIGCATTKYFATLGMLLVKTVTRAGPGGKFLSRVEVKEVLDQLATGEGLVVQIHTTRSNSQCISGAIRPGLTVSNFQRRVKMPYRNYREYPHLQRKMTPQDGILTTPIVHCRPDAKRAPRF